MRIVDLSLVSDFTMTKGLGNLQAKEACVVAQASILDSLSKGREIKKLTTKLSCSCPVLNTLAINLNDINWWKSNLERTEVLRPFISALLDSKVNCLATASRASLVSAFAQHAYKSISCHSIYTESERRSQQALKCVISDSNFAFKYANYAIGKNDVPAKDRKKYAKYSSEFAFRAAEYTKSVTEYALYGKSYDKNIELRDELIRTFWACEAIKD